MNAPIPTPPPPPPPTPAIKPVSTTRYYHWLVLLALLVAGTLLRVRDIETPTLWFDEYLSVFLSTGRDQPADSPFTKPPGVILQPFATGFAGAPPWWKIWTGMSITFHPPIYHILLRWWIDLFDDGDVAVRAMSCFFSLAGIVLLFDILRKTQGPWPGLCAAALMATSAATIEMSHEVRSYTLLVFLGLVLIWIMLAIQRRGVSWPKLTALGFAAAAMALTHYLSVGALLAMGLYVLIAWRGRTRRLSLATFAVAGLLVVALWAHTLASTYQRVWDDAGTYLVDINYSPQLVAYRLQTTPAMLTLIRSYALREDWQVEWGLFLLVFAVPILRFRRSPDTLLWWLWTVGALAVPAAIDVHNHYRMLWFEKYIFLASPGIFALLCTPIPVKSARIGLLIPLIVIGFSAWGSIQYEPRIDWKENQWGTMAQKLQAAMRPGDVLAISAGDNFQPGAAYIVLNRYADLSGHPVIFFEVERNQHIEPAALKQLEQAGRGVWVLGKKPTASEFPGWTLNPEIADDPAKGYFIWEVIPPGKSSSTAPPPAPSR